MFLLHEPFGGAPRGALKIAQKTRSWMTLLSTASASGELLRPSWFPPRKPHEAQTYIFPMVF